MIVYNNTKDLRRKQGMVNARSLVAVHTHTHTHTTYSLVNNDAIASLINIPKKT